MFLLLQNTGVNKQDLEIPTLIMEAVSEAADSICDGDLV